MTMLLPTLYSQQFPCDGSVYYVGTNTVVGSQLFQLNIDPLTGTIQSRQLALDNPDGRHITALGYNVRDRMLYALDFDTYELLRIGSDGRMEVLDKKDFDPEYEIYGGGMTADGLRLLLIGRNKERGEDDRLYSIRVNEPGYPFGSFPLNADRPVKMVDLAIDPQTGNVYSFDEVRGHIVETGTLGQTYTNLGYKEVNQVFGSLFFDQNGNLYGLGNASGGGAEQTIIYGIKKGSGATTRLTQVPGGRDTDACGCPYTLDFRKEILPGTVDGCGEIVIEYSSLNYGGIGQLGVQLRDTLPPGFVITQVELPQEDYFVKVINGEGSNIIAVDDWNLLLGDNTIRIHVQLMTNLSGPVPGQAQLENLFAAYGSRISSDDPATPEMGDPTILEIVDENSFQLEDYIEYSCDLDTAYLHLPLSGTYNWSTGSTDSVIAVTQNGSYALTLTTDCFTVEDDIQLKQRTEPYYIDAGLDRTVRLGMPVNLTYTHNLEQVIATTWRSLGADSLSCIDCEQSSLTAIQSGVVEVEVIDQRGCVFSDQLAYEVRQTKNIYLPNAFSPDGDGVNDFFAPLGDTGTIEHFEITDRWGSRIFSESGGQINEISGWDGKLGTRLAPSGAYYYQIQIRFPDGEVQQYQGSVLLVR